MIGATMAELQLVGPATERQPQNLMPETNTEDRHTSNQLAHLRSLIFEGLRISGSIRQKDSLGIHREHILGGGGRGDYGQAASDLDQTPQDVALDPEIISDDVELGISGMTCGLGWRAGLDALSPL